MESYTSRHYTYPSTAPPWTSSPRWHEGDPHRSSSKVLGTQGEIAGETDSLQVPCVQEIRGKTLSGPVPPPLPDFRVRRDSPITSTGVDFAGPLYVKATGNSKGTKVWICLYTCCTVRAIRGLPRRIISDNAKTFKAADKAIQATVKSREVQEHLAGLRVEWKFNVERAPWWGGIIERMVR